MTERGVCRVFFSKVSRMTIASSVTAYTIRKVLVISFILNSCTCPAMDGIGLECGIPSDREEHAAFGRRGRKVTLYLLPPISGCSRLQASPSYTMIWVYAVLAAGGNRPLMDATHNGVQIALGRIREGQSLLVNSAAIP